MASDPGPAAIPVSYMVCNFSDGAVKRHAGAYTWEIAVGADASAKLVFHGATPMAQAADIPNPSGGTTIEAEARAAIDAILVALEGKGLLAGS